MATPLRVLIIEDSEDDALLLVHERERGDYAPIYEWVDMVDAMITALDRRCPYTNAVREQRG